METATAAFDPVKLRRLAKKRDRLLTEIEQARDEIAGLLVAGNAAKLGDTELGELANLSRMHVYTIRKQKKEEEQHGT